MVRTTETSPLPPILVAEDEEPARQIFERFFIKMRLSNPVRFAGDGDEALRFLDDAEAGRQAWPALVLLDMRMPKKTGLDVLRWMRRESSRRDIPVVMLTGSAEIDEVSECYALGVASYLVKPVGFAALNDVIQRLGQPWALLSRLDGHPIAAERATQPAREAPRTAGGPPPVDRAGFVRRIREAIAGGPGPTGLILMELERLGAVNQVLGYSAGDRLLASVASRLEAQLPPGALAARFGDNVLTVLVPGAAERETAALARRLRSVLQAPVDTGAGVVTPGIVAGVTAVVGDPDIDDVLRRLDAALTGARLSGSRVLVHDPVLERAITARQSMAMALEAAVTRSELVLHYQPVIDLRDNHLVSVEALVRWRRPGLEEVVMPGEFIGPAEETGAILDIGLWVLEQACRQVRTWSERYRPADPLEVGVNLSVRQLESQGLIQDVNEIITASGIEPGLVNLEITESAFMTDTEEMIRRLRALKALGLRLSMDDFGTGYSSLSYLRRLPIDMLKIDRSFVDGIAKTDEEWALAVAIVKVATSLGKQTLAEGIETGAQVAHLRSLHCDYGQGYLFGRPMAAEEFEELLAAGR